MSAALEAEWHDATVEAVAWQGSVLVVDLKIWIHDAATRRCRLHPARLSLAGAEVEGPLVPGYEVLGGTLFAAEGSWDDMIPVPFALGAATLRWNEGCSGPLSPVTAKTTSATFEITGPATAEETMP